LEKYASEKSQLMNTPVMAKFCLKSGQKTVQIPLNIVNKVGSKKSPMIGQNGAGWTMLF